MVDIILVANLFDAEKLRLEMVISNGITGYKLNGNTCFHYQQLQQRIWKTGHNLGIWKIIF